MQHHNSKKRDMRPDPTQDSKAFERTRPNGMHATMKFLSIGKLCLLLTSSLLACGEADSDLRLGDAVRLDEDEVQNSEQYLKLTTRRTRAVNNDVVSLDKRVEETLRNRKFMRDGDKVTILWDNVSINVGAVKLGETNTKHGIQARITKIITKSNRNDNAAIKFSVNGKGDFQRTFSSVVSRGIRWSKNNDIKAITYVTPRGKSKDKVTFPLDQRAPFATRKKASVSYKFDGVTVSPRSKAQPTGFFQVVENNAPFTTEVRINANGKLKIRIKRGNKITPLLLTLKEALGPNRGGGFKETDTQSRVLFTARGRIFWTTTDRALLNVEEFSLDSNTNSVPFKTRTIDDEVEV